MASGTGLAACAAGGVAMAALTPAVGYVAVPAAIAGAGLLWLFAVVPEVGPTAILVTCTLWSTARLNEFSVPFFSGGLKPLDLLLIASFGSFLVRRAFAAPAARPIPTSAGLLVLALIAWAVLATARGLLHGNGKDSLYELRAILHYLAFFQVAMEFSPRSVRRVIAALFVAAVLVSCRAVLEYRAEVGGGEAVGGLYRVMNFEFSYLVFVIILAVALLCEGGLPVPFSLATLVFSFAGLFVAFYRTSYLVLALSAAPLAVFSDPRGRRRLGAGVLGAALAATLLVPPLFSVAPETAKPFELLEKRVSTIDRFRQDVSAEHRLAEWNASVKIAEAHPLLGAGLGTRVRFWSPMYDQQHDRWGFWSDNFYMHNSYLWFAAKMGLPALALFLSLTGTVLRMGFKGLDAPDPGGRCRGLLTGLMTCLVATLLLAVFGPVLSTQGVSPFVAFALGSVCVLARERLAAAAATQRGR
jgi:O-antigen ligase